jgi:hypothetical protein
VRQVVVTQEVVRQVVVTQEVVRQVVVTTTNSTKGCKVCKATPQKTHPM